MRISARQFVRSRVTAAVLCVAVGASASAARQSPHPASMGPDVPSPVAVRVAAPSSESRPLGISPSPTPSGRRPSAESQPISRELKPAAGGSARTVWALTAVLAVIVVAGMAARMIARRHGGLHGALGPGGRSPAGVLEVLGRYPVARGATLVLLKLDRRVLLLSQSAGGRLGAGAGFSTLCEVTDPEEVASILVKTRDAEGESMAHRFRSMLTRFDGEIADADAGAGRGRRVVGSPGGDRAELWDASKSTEAIPVVDLTVGMPGGGSTGLAAALRRKIASMGGGRAA